MIYRLLHILFISIVLSSCQHQGDDTIRYIPDVNKDYSQIELKLLDDAINNDSDNDELLHRRAKLFLKFQDYERGLIDINKAIAENDQIPDYYITKINLLMATNRADKALEVVKLLDKLDVNEFEFNLVKAKVYLKLDNYRLALDNANRAQRYLPSSYEIYLLKGQIYSNLGDTTRSLSNFNYSIQKRKDVPETYQYIAAIYENQRDFTTAMNFVRTGLSFNPKDAMLHFRKGSIYEKINLKDSAKVLYQMAVDLDPGLYWAEYKLGLWYMDVGNYSSAEPYFQKVVKYTNSIPKAEYYLGLCYWYTGKYEYAHKLLEKVALQDTSNHEAINNLNKIKAKLQLITENSIHAFRKQDSVLKAKSIKDSIFKKQ